MGKSVLLYEQIYNDLTAAVARAKQACRKRKSSPSKIAAPDKKQRGRPKGSKDTVPRQVKAKVQVQSGSSDCVSESMACSVSNQVFCSVFNQSAISETAACFPPQSEIKFFDTLVVNDFPTETSKDLAVNDFPTETSKDPSCWELPLP